MCYRVCTDIQIQIETNAIQDKYNKERVPIMHIKTCAYPMSHAWVYLLFEVFTSVLL